MSNSDNSRLLLSSAVLAGLTPLIPLPFVDDLVYTQFMRQMSVRLASSHGVALDNETIRVLSDAPGGSCLPGCLGTILIYPVKKLFRKLFFFLEWKRAVDIVSHTYHHGYLLDTALRHDHLKSHEAKEVRAALDRVLRQADTRLFERTVRGVFRQSKSILRRAGNLLKNRLPAQQDEIAQAMEELEEEETQQVAGIVAQLQQALSNLPAGYFERLEELFNKELGEPR